MYNIQNLLWSSLMVSHYISDKMCIPWTFICMTLTSVHFLKTSEFVLTVQGSCQRGDGGGQKSPTWNIWGGKPPTNFHPFLFKIDKMAPMVLPGVATVPQTHSSPVRTPPPHSQNPGGNPAVVPLMPEPPWLHSLWYSS